MRFFRSWVLPAQIHVFEAMAVTTLQRVVGFETRALMIGQFQAFGVEFFARVDGAEKCTPNFFGGLHLARDLVCPLMWKMGVWTSSTGA